MINQPYVRIQRMRCVNCGEEIDGYVDEEGMTKMTCHRCGTVTVSKKMSRRHMKIDVYGPPNQVLLNN